MTEIYYDSNINRMCNFWILKDGFVRPLETSIFTIAFILPKLSVINDILILKYD